MTPAEFKAYRLALNPPLRQLDLATAFGYSVQSIRNWEQGKQVVPRWAEQLIKYYYRHGVPAEVLAPPIPEIGTTIPGANGATLTMIDARHVPPPAEQ